MNDRHFKVRTLIHPVDTLGAKSILGLNFEGENGRMAIRFRAWDSKSKFSNINFDKIIKSKKNMSRPSPTIWSDRRKEFTDTDKQGLRVLNLNHPSLLVLDSCDGIREFNQVHAQLVVSGLFQHSLTASRIVKKLCSSSHAVPHAVFLYNWFEEPDAFLCNTIIRSYVNMNDPYNALSFFYENMIGKTVDPNHYTFPIVVKACAVIGLLQEGEKAHCRVVKFGFDSDLFVRNSMIHMYSVCGRVGHAWLVFDEGTELDLVSYNSMIDGFLKNGAVGTARKLFDEMPLRDVFSWNSMIAGYAGIGDMEAAEGLFGRMHSRDVVTWNCMIDGYAMIRNLTEACRLFDKMPVRNVVSWNTMLALYVRVKDYDECLRFFDRMVETEEAVPNEATLVSVLTSCANLGRLDKGKLVHAYVRSKIVNPDELLSTALLTMFAKCGAMYMAREIFDAMPSRSVVSWNSLIMGYGMHGEGEKALQLFLDMEKRGLTPNDATFICILSACTHSGMVLEGWWCFDLMRQVYKIEPKVEHYGCMIDLLARAGLTKDSEELIRNMSMEAEPALWGALLSSCRTHSNSELGEIVAKRLIVLKPQDIGPYILLSNIYAARGRWDDVENVRITMKNKGLHKAAGFSTLNLEESVSKVEIENNSAYRKSLVYSMLSDMGHQMKSTHGYLDVN